MEKVKTLLIDDEMLALEFLENLICWEDAGFQLVGSAVSAEEGLRLFEENRPDLVITDICMPDKNGLELCREFKQMKPDVKLIILTAYKNFDYAQLAIEVGVIDYIVKHEITEKTLQVKMAKVLQIFQENNKEIQKKIKYGIKQLMSGGSTNQESVQELSEKLDDDKKYFVLLVYFHETDGKVAYLNSDTCGNLADMQQITEFEMNESIYIFLSSINKSTYLFHMEELKRYAGAVTFEGSERDKKDTVCLIRISEQKVEMLEESYTMCLKYKKYMKLLGKRDGLVLIGEKEEAVLKRKDGFSDYQEEIFQISVSVKKKELYAAIEQLRVLYLEHLMQVGSIRDIHLCGQSVLHILIKALSAHVPGKQKEEDVYRYQLAMQGSLEEIYKFFRRGFEELRMRKEDGRYARCSDKIKSAVGFIHENYMKAIGINDIADNTRVSESYLVKNFKKEMGVTILDYLTEVRIHAAKEQLINQNSKIYEVAEKTGYSTSQYFSMVFMKKTGMTPKQYKEMYTEKE